MDKRPSTPCQCVLSAAEANRVGAESKPGENAAEHLHWRTCLKRQERVQVSAEGPSLRIDAAEPKDFLEDLEAGRAEAVRGLYRRIYDQGGVGYVPRKVWLNLTEGTRYNVGATEFVAESDRMGWGDENPAWKGLCGSKPAQALEDFQNRDAFQNSANYEEERKKLKEEMSERRLHTAK